MAFIPAPFIAVFTVSYLGYEAMGAGQWRPYSGTTGKNIQTYLLLRFCGEIIYGISPKRRVNHH